MSYIGSTPTTQSFIAGTDYFNGTGAQINFTLSRSVNSVNDIEVIVNNVEQIPSGYSVSGTTLTFSAAPSAGTSNVYVRYLSTTNLSLAIPAGTSATFNTVGVTGNLNFTGTGNRITGDFSNATVANSVFFQTSTANGQTRLRLIPNGTATDTALDFYTTSTDLANSSRLSLRAGAADMALVSTREGTGTYLPMAFYTGGSERVRIDTSGNVGIGTSSPGQKLDVAGNVGASGVVLGSYGVVQCTNSTTGLSLLGGNQVNGANSGGQINLRGTVENRIEFLRSGNVETARIDSSGNLQVGTTSPIVGERLSVAGTGTYVAAFNQGTNTSGYNVLRLGLNPNGNNTSSYFLHGNTNTVGNWFLYGNGTSSFSSDARLKKNIETTRDGYLEDVVKLRVVKYNWRNDEEGKPRELGLIAQEVEQVFPGLVQDDKEKVSEDDETRYKSLKQSVLPFILLKAIQEQQTLITALTARITALESK